MLLRVATLILMLGFLAGCNNPVPNPEHLDPIYQDLEKQLKEVEATVASIKVEVKEYEKTLQEVEPHTGQIHYARKRLYEAQAILRKNEQQATYLKVRLESRKDEVFISYMKAFRAQQPWPNPKEFADYKAIKAMREQPISWRPKERLEKYESQFKKPAAKAGGEGAPAAGGH